MACVCVLQVYDLIKDLIDLDKDITDVPSRPTKKLAACPSAVCLSVCLSVCLNMDTITISGGHRR